MFCIRSRQYINVITDSISNALLKKTNNTSLSSKTLEKLAKISNTSIGLSTSDAKDLFVYGKSIAKSESSENLLKELNNIIPYVLNDSVKNKINTLINNCGKLNITNASTKKLSHLKPAEQYEAPKNTTFLIRNNSQNAISEACFVKKEIDLTPNGEPYGMNISLENSKNEEIASGRCSIQENPGEGEFLFISALYVEGNGNFPTIAKPNEHVGAGRILMYEMMKFGNEHNVKSALLTPLRGSEGFYLKMGFLPKVEGSPNRMPENNRVVMSKDSKLNQNWIKNFEQASFLNDNFRGGTWSGNTSLIYNELQKQISNMWEIK